MTRASPRNFFSRLRYTEDSGFESGKTPAIGYPVFSQLELEQAPLKWLKYVLLARLGLRRIKDLEKDIYRYPIQDWRSAQECCDRLISEAKQDEVSILLVVKLIPMDKAGQLPNFRITNNEKLDQVFEAILANLAPEFREIWVCQTVVDFKTSSFAGRLTIPGYQNYGASWLELVWFTSPRLLESVNWHNSTHPSLRAFRPVDGFEYRIDQLHIPSIAAAGYEITYQRCVQDFRWLKSKIFAYKERIMELEAILSAAGAQELCLEFKVDNGYFRFIDWDTEIENLNAPITSNQIF